MARQKTGQGDAAGVREVNTILQNLRGEQFRHERNVQGKSVSTSALAAHNAHNQPTLPFDLIYPQHEPAPAHPWVPGPDPPKSWRSSADVVKNDADEIDTDTPAWRARALSLLFSALTPNTSRPIYPDPSPVPQLTLLCLQRIRAVCPAPDLVDVVRFIPPHLRRALVRYAAVHAPLSRTELDALCGQGAHVDTELVIVGPQNTLRAQTFQASRNGSADAEGGGEKEEEEEASSLSWDADADAAYAHDGDAVLRTLAIVSSPLSTATLLSFPPTITHLVLIHIPHRVSLPRLPAICPLIVLLDLSCNAWLRKEPLILENVEWTKLRRLEVLGLKECTVTPKLCLELNRGRWKTISIIR